MKKTINGIQFSDYGGYSICHVEYLSEEIKALIKKNLSVICHGTKVLGANKPIYSYVSTIKNFLERYKTKEANTQKGIMGEFLSHILITELYEDFEVVSAFFNMEENSIRKGFDILLCKTTNQTLFITEVKSGNLHKGKNHDQTTLDLLTAAKNDLYKRLNEQKITYWHNAINSVRSSMQDEKDYKKTLIGILEDFGSEVSEDEGKSNNKSVVLVSNLFEPLMHKISHEPVKEFLEELQNSKIFADVIIICIQKETYSRVVDFLESEVV
jgi:hypothetical protein